MAPPTSIVVREAPFCLAPSLREKIAVAAARAYERPPWHRNHYLTCNACRGLYLRGHNLPKADRSAHCIYCYNNLVLTEHRLAEFFGRVLSRLEADSGPAVVTTAEYGWDVAGARLAINFARLCENASAEAQSFITELLEHIELKPEQVDYTIDMFVAPIAQSYGIAKLLATAHAEAARKSSRKALIGWTASYNVSMLEGLKRSGFIMLPSRLNSGISPNPHLIAGQFRISVGNPNNAVYFLKLL